MTTDTTQLTPQQHAAIHTRGVSIALSAGAGCGKTFVLTRRYLAHLVADRPFADVAAAVTGQELSANGVGFDQDLLHGVVAITFTERAAREMRDRIRSACQEALRAGNVEQVDHWLAVLRGLDTARISTIHSFCAALLRAHAVEAGIDPQFAVLEKTTGDVLLRRAVSEAVEQLLEKRNEDAMHLVLHFGWERTQDLVRSLVAGRFHAGTTDFTQRDPAAHAEAWRRNWRDESVPQLLRDLVESFAAIRVLKLFAENEPSHAEMQRRRDTILRDLPRIVHADDPQAALLALHECAKIQGGGGKSAWGDDGVYEAVRTSLEDLRKAIKKVLEDLDVDDTDVEEAARFSLAFCRVAQHAAVRYAEKKQEAGALDFDDLLLRTRDLLRNDDFVRARAAHGIDLLMIDEFQDTDPVQSEIVERLCGEQLLHGKLFLVGDAKQSIYRFRRADPTVFAGLRARFPEAGRLPLSTNFRSQPQILKFVNCLFAESLGPEYEPLVAHVDQLTAPPAIEFLFSSSDASEEQVARELADQRRRREADWIARRLSGLLRGAERPVRRKRADSDVVELDAARPGDIAILFRTLSNVALYEEALRRYGIDYYLVGGRAFYAQQEIFDVVNLCSCLDDPDDEVSLAGVLRSPIFGLCDDALFAMADSAGSLRAALEVAPAAHLPETQRDQWRHAARVLEELRLKKDRLPLASLLRLAVDRTGYDAALLNEFLGRRKVANLHKLLEMAREFDRSGLCTMSEFVTRLRESVLEQTDEELAAVHPETSNVVRLMTIHQAKGLEFPVVVVADMDWTRRGGGTSARHDARLGPLVPLPPRRGVSRRNLGQRMHQLADTREEENENIRLLYVATTRAADVLILSAGLPPERRLSSPWMQLLARRFDLDTGLPARDPWLGRLSLGNVSPDQIPQIRVHHRAPEIGGRAEPLGEAVPLTKFRETVGLAEPAPLPSTLTPIPPRASANVVLTVSAIEEADSEQRPVDVPAVGAIDVSEGGDESADAENLGTLVHSVLERIDPRAPSGLEALVDAALAKLSPQKNETLRAAALARSRAFVESELFSEIAGAAKVHRELEFILRWPPGKGRAPMAVISGKIDCVFESPDGRWTLVDYKTGRLPVTQPGAVIEKYGVQMALYALALGELIGRLPDAVEIVAVHDAVRRFRLDVSPAFISAISRRVDAAVAGLRGADAPG